MESLTNLKTQNKFLVTKGFDALGTNIEISLIVDEESLKEKATRDLEILAQKYDYYSKIFSRFDLQSELSRLNSNLNKLIPVSIPMRRLIDFALAYYQKTQNLFDPRIIDVLEGSGYAQSFDKGVLASSNESNNITSKLSEDLELKTEGVKFKRRMDFSGIAKGFINDEVVGILKEKGWKNFLVDSGGDMYFKGLDQFGKEWTIDVEGIDKSKLILQLSDLAVATSGISRRKWELGGKKFHHLINPIDPNEFSFDLKSVTVVSSCTIDADVWAKTLFLMGKEKGFIFAKENSIAAVFLGYNGIARITSTMKKYNFYQNQDEN
jgi:thiamine biosynthesis lipoprotein